MSGKRVRPTVAKAKVIIQETSNIQIPFLIGSSPEFQGSFLNRAPSLVEALIEKCPRDASLLYLTSNLLENGFAFSDHEVIMDNLLSLLSESSDNLQGAVSMFNTCYSEGPDDKKISLKKRNSIAYESLSLKIMIENKELFEIDISDKSGSAPAKRAAMKASRRRGSGYRNLDAA